MLWSGLPPAERMSIEQTNVIDCAVYVMQAAEQLLQSTVL